MKGLRFLLAALAAIPLAAPAQARQPNILIIWGDDVGLWNVSAYSQGMMGYKTPNIDRIAKEGGLFTDWYGQQSCTAGRASFITGQVGFRTGMLKVGLPGAKEGLQARDVTIAELLKARGYNAVRASHNPFSPAFLRACDRQGLLVIGEAFDVWRAPKLAQDYSVYFADHWRGDVAAMVLSGRNHPSIVMWSIGNEIPSRNTPEGVETQWLLANEVHKLDPSRPVTAAKRTMSRCP